MRLLLQFLFSDSLNHKLKEALKTRAVRSGSKSASKQETVSSSDLMLTLLEVDAGRITCYRFLSLMFISKSQ